MSGRQEYSPDRGDWICASCGKALELKKMQIIYLENAFDVTLPQCPRCGRAFVPKSLAEGRMAEVESLLEDK
jgi:tRNA(Ile2) C34 agmatinyltransferase TiaS